MVSESSVQDFLGSLLRDACVMVRALEPGIFEHHLPVMENIAFGVSQANEPICIISMDVFYDLDGSRCHVADSVQLAVH